MNKVPAMWQEQDKNNDQDLDIKPMLVSIYRHKWPILALALLAGVIAFLYANTLVPLYQAQATLLIESEEANIVAVQDVYSTGYRGYEYTMTQYELLKSRNLAERVVRELELHRDPRFPMAGANPDKQGESASSQDKGWRSWIDLSFLKPASQVARQQPTAALSQEQLEERHIENLAGMIAGGIIVDPVSDSKIVSISYRADDPVFASQVVNSLADQYIESYLDARLAATRKASEWLTERLGGLRENLALAEQRLQAFTDREKLVDLEGITTLGARQISDLTSRYNEARERRATAELIRQEVQRLGSASTAQYLIVPAVQRHELIRNLRQMQADAQRRVNELGQRYGVKHPTMIAAVSELNSIQNDLTSEVDKVISGIDSEYQLALRAEQSLWNQLEAAKEEFRDVNRKNFELQELQREVETNRQLYDLFFTRMQETNQAGGFERANARVIDAARVPSGPVSPNKKLIVLVGLFGGLLLGVSAAVLYGILDNTVKTPDDVESKLNSSLVGVLPIQKKDSDGYMESYWQNSKTIYAESLRTVRTGVVLSGIDNPHKVVVITSALPSEGKSTVSLNLGAAFAQIEKTLVIGADMRKPTLASKCGLSPRHPGLSNYIAGNISLDDCIAEFGVPNLYVMPSGLIPPNPLELLSSPQFAHAIDELAERFDRIIIDSAPVHSVSDALILASFADALLYVVKADSTSATLARRGIERLAAVNAPITGVILNLFSPQKVGRYYGGGEYAYQSYYGTDEQAPSRGQAG